MAACTRPNYGAFVPLSPASAEFRKLLRKHSNSVETGANSMASKFHIPRKTMDNVYRPQRAVNSTTPYNVS